MLNTPPSLLRKLPFLCIKIVIIHYTILTLFLTPFCSLFLRCTTTKAITLTGICRTEPPLSRVILLDPSFSQIWFLFVAMWVFTRWRHDASNHSSSSRHPLPLLLWNRSPNRRGSRVFGFGGFDFGWMKKLLVNGSLIEKKRRMKIMGWCGPRQSHNTLRV